MSYVPSSPARRRLDALKASAALSLATVQRCHAEGSASRLHLEAQYSNWRNSYYGRDGYTGRKHYGGSWQDETKAREESRWYNPNDREYYCDAIPDGLRHHEKSADMREDNPGWYCDSECRETVTGSAVQFPSRDGKPRYCPALTWSDRDGVTLRPLDVSDELADALRSANAWAERVADEEREYNDAWQAGSDAARLDDELAEARAEALEALDGLERGKARRFILEAYCETREENREAVREAWSNIPSRLEDAYFDGRSVNASKPRALWAAKVESV